MNKPKSAKRIVRASLRATGSLVEKIGGRLTPASGAGLVKGDGRVQGRFRIETKCPPTQKYRITVDDFTKIWLAATQAGEVAVFHIKLGKHEIIFLRDVDYRGLGGTETNIGDLEWGQKGHRLNVHIWVGLRMLHDHWRFPVQGRVSGTQREFLLRAMPYQDFVELADRKVST